MDELLKLKKTLKQWEAEFSKQHGKKPGKTDIDSASGDIQECYMKYTKIKKILKETESQPREENSQSAGNSQKSPSSQREPAEKENLSNGNEEFELTNENEGTRSADEDGEEIEVWGSQFDRKTPAAKEKEKAPAQKKETNAYLQKLGSKMFQQSLKLKHNKASPSSLGSWRFANRDVASNSDKTAVNSENLDEGGEWNSYRANTMEVDTSPVQVDDKTSNLNSQNGMVERHKEMVFEEDSTPAKFKLFEKASMIAKPKTERSKGENTDCFLDKFTSRLKSKQTVLPSSLSKVVSLHREKYGEPDCEAESFYYVDGNKSLERKNEKRSRADEKDEFDNDFEREFQEVIEERSTYTEWKKGDGGENNTSKNELKTSNDLATTEEQKAKTESENAENEKKADNSIYEFENRNSPVKFERGKRTRVSRVAGRVNKYATRDVENDQPVTGRDRDYNPDINDREMSDGDYDGNNTDSKKRKPAKNMCNRSPKRRKIASEAGAENDESGEGFSTASRRPAPKAKPVSNDNFIRLNMKIKTYKRKGKTMSGPQYKRMMWKQKMQSRSKSYGDACFKCGQSGHWANKCPGNQASGSSASKEPVVDEDFPSLQEAAMLARGVTVDEQRKRKSGTKDADEDFDETKNTKSSWDNNRMEDEELKLEAEIVRSRLEEPPPPPAMDPLIEIGENDPLPDLPDFVKRGLKKFGFESFRPGQEEAVVRILCGLSTLVVLSTGGGKSLCYQLPAYLYSQRSKCITLVVSPLVSLMEDQVTGLPQGIRGVCLHTNMTSSQRESVLGSVRDGKAQFLLVSPEAIAGGSMSLLASMSSLPPIAFACIDEAHCLSEWSHNFRPSYLRLCKVLQDKLGVRCFLGLTATATLSTASDVARHLRITDFRRATVRGSPIPDNLYLSVSRDENRDEAIVGLLQGERFCNLGSIIIYCTRRDQTDRVATLIRTCLNKGVPQEVTTKKNRKKSIKLEWDAESYHAGLTPAQRKRVQNAFMSGRLRVVVATVAFGMGLDKSDVRGIIHYNMPKSFESYVQEIGRAGRDREPAQCHVFLDPEGKDLCELRRHTYANTVDYKTLKRLVQKLFPSCRCREVHQKHVNAVKEVAETKDGGETDVTAETTAKGRLCPGHERAMPIERTVMELDVKEEGISTLMCYLELHSQQWLENLSNVYATCKVQCYGGPSQLQAVAKKCPPVAVAIAKARKDGKSFANTNTIEFPVVEISDAMGWDSGPVKKELKLLQWDFSGAVPKKTGVMVEFSELAYHFRSPGDLSDEELDDVLQFLHTRVQRQEKTELSQLSRLYQALKSVSHKNYWMCSDSLDMARNDKLKAVLNEYFDSQSVEETGNLAPVLDEPIPKFNLDQVISDIRQFHNLYGQEHSLSGRAIARIFHGIASPCFPATTWGRVRRFWRSHLDVDFNELMKIATKELIHLR